MTLRTISVFALSAINIVIGAPAYAETFCEQREANTRSSACIQTVQFDTDADGVAGCVNQCKLDLEICLGLRPAGESSDRCDKIEDQCEDACYNSGSSSGEND